MAYPEPLVIPPRKLPHKQTFILLHGRGSCGIQFGPALLDSPIPCPTSPSERTSAGNNIPSPTTTMMTIDQAFPHARFVFPTAARRRATIYHRAYTHQWFDNWKLNPRATEREELQAPGLQETSTYIHNLLRAEIATVPGGAANIILGGLSQGCAASLISLLLWEGDPLAAVMGMCGWLPYSTRLLEQMDLEAPDAGETGDTYADNDSDVFDPFRDADDDAEECSLGPDARAMAWLREETEVHTSSQGTGNGDFVFKGVPVFLGHGTEDDRVSVVLGRDASCCLPGLGIDAKWLEYEGLGHWYSGPMLRDLVEFVREKTGWE